MIDGWGVMFGEVSTVQADHNDVEPSRQSLTKTKMNTIYTIGLGQTYYDYETGMTVLRVPGGWVFFSQSNSVFVPFNNEFMTAA